jgi:hypothetical protein
LLIDLIIEWDSDGGLILICLSFILTERCNWKCEYCEYPLIDEPKDTTIEIMSRHLPYIKRLWNDVVWADVCGGEIGLLSSDILRYFFKTLDQPIVVSTNGMFLDKGYHLDPEIKPYIKEIFLHLDMKNKRNYVDDVKKGIVHNDLDEMIDFIKNNPEDIFDYVEFEFDINKPRKMDMNIYKKLYTAIQDIDNVSEYAKDIIKRRLNEPNNLRLLCSWFNKTAEIDLVNERIPLCHRSRINHIKLNERNLKKRINTIPRLIYGSKNNCQSCTRLYAGKMNYGLSDSTVSLSNTTM